MTEQMETFASLRARPLLEPLASFGETRTLSPRVHAVGSGLYVMTREDNLAYAVCWAESEYWARRVGDLPYTGELVPPFPTDDLLSAESLGLTAGLEYGAILAHEREQPQFSVISYHANYRMTDGAFISLEIDGANRTQYHFGSTKPKKHDRPVAIEFKLADTKQRMPQAPR